MRARWLQSFLLLAMGCQSHSVLSLGTRPEDTTDDVEPTPTPTPAPDVEDHDAAEPTPAPDVEDRDAAVEPTPMPELDAALAPTMGPPPVPTIAELDAAVVPDPEPVPIHRYSFDGTGTVSADSVGGADGLILGGATLNDSGTLVLDGIDDYIELPQRLVSGLDEVTLMVWAAVHVDSCWQRLFDFGNEIIVGETAEADTTIYLTPKHCLGFEGPAAYVQFRRSLPGGGFVREFLSARREQLVELDVQHQFAMVLGGPAALLYLYIDGVEQARRSLVPGDGGVAFTLNELVDVNCWIGRSQYAGDPFLNATMAEFRIYDRALASDSVRAAFQAGPDALP